MIDLFKQTACIAELLDEKQISEIIFRPMNERIVNRSIIEFSAFCGTYGQGGPGFFGLKLAAANEYPEEWLLLIIYGACDWVTVNGEWLEAHPKQYYIKRPLTSHFSNQMWDDFSPLIIGQKIDSLIINKKSMTLMINSVTVSIDEDPSKRPGYPGNNKPRILFPKEDLRDALIIAPWPWVQI